MANERLSYEIAAIYSGSPEIRKAFDDFAKLNAQGNNVVNQLQKIGSQARATGEEIRNSRQGAAQLGMQFNQLATQIAGGTSPLLAFQQQLGDVGYSMSFMSGTAGTVGRFLAGPWGAAIITATSVLTPFIAKLFDSGDAAKNAADNFRSAADEARNLVGSMNVAKLANAQIGLNKLRDERFQLEARVARLPYANDPNAGVFDPNRRLGGAKRRIQEINWAIAEQSNLIKIAESENAKLEDLVNRRVGGASRSSGSSRAARSAGASAAQSTMDAYEKALRQAKPEIDAQGNSWFERWFPDAMWGGPIEAGISDITAQLNEFTSATYPEMMRALYGPNEEMIKSFDAIGMSVNNAFKGMLTAGASWKDGMKGIIQSVIDELWRMFVVQQIVGFVSKSISSAFGGAPPLGGAAPGSLESSFDKAFSIGANANGTPSWKGGMTWVGERGPELVNLPGGSRVIPAHRASQMGGGGMTINVDARGSADPAAVRAQVQQGILQAAPAIVAAAEQRTINSLRRPRLGGAIQ